MIRVLVADDQRLVREGIGSILALYEDLKICGLAADGKEAVQMAASKSPDLVLLDIRMPVMDGISAAEEILERGLAKRVIMLTTFDDDQYILRALQAGASGYLLKDLPPQELYQAILTVHEGGFLSTAAIMEKIRKKLVPAGISTHGDETRLEALSELSPRELDVLKLIGEGATNKEIAQELSLSEGTIKNYITSILDAMGFRDRIQAALFAARNNL